MKAKARNKRSGSVVSSDSERTELRLPGLPDHLTTGLDVILVGINPSLRSAELGHHFAGRNNRFWRLLHESGLLAEPVSFEQDYRLPALGLGLTNIVERATRGIADLSQADFREGRARLVDKLRFRPRAVVFVGVSVYREFLPALGLARSATIRCGLQSIRFDGMRLFVVPNPSGRNAHYSYDEMLGYWKEVKQWLSVR